MANETTVTVIGNLTEAPTLRFTASGIPVANFTIASTPKRFDRGTNKYADEETIFMRCSAWRDIAENIAESFPDKGSRVIAQGRLRSRSFETKEGERRTVIELDVDELGPSLRFATARVTRTTRGQGGNAQGGGQQYGGRPPASDPWSSGGQSAGSQAQSWDDQAGAASEPPF